MAITGHDDSELPTTREEVWTRLERLLDRATSQGMAALSDRQVEELGKLYRASASHLALLRGFGASSGRLERVNRLVSRAHSTVYGRPKKHSFWRSVSLLVLAIPVTVRKTALYHLVAFGILLLGAVYGYLGAAADPEWALEFAAPGDTRTPYASRAELLEMLRHGREGELGASEKTAFASFLWTHNTRIAILAFFLGVLCAVPTALLVLMNGVMLGVYTRVHHSHDLASEWWAWILPHGVTELGAVCLLAGGGLWIGRLVISPGPGSRLQAFRSARGDMARLLLFAFPMLLIAALIESFLRQSALPDPPRYGFAVLTAVLWGAYLGLVRPPRSLVESTLEARTLAERAVPMPELSLAPFAAGAEQEAGHGREPDGRRTDRNFRRSAPMDDRLSAEA